MAGTAIAYWPGITEEQIASQPPFWDDGHAWAEWIAALEAEPDSARTLVELGAGALLSVSTPEYDDDDIDWVTPSALRAAAASLREAIADDRPGSRHLVELYGRHAGGEVPAAEEFRATLMELDDLARYAEGQGMTRMTVQVSW